MTTLVQEMATIDDVPEGCGVLAVLDATGDTKLIWDRSNAEEVAAARAMFDKLVKEKRFVAYKVNRKGEKGEVVREFDPSAEKLILAPPLVGG